MATCMYVITDGFGLVCLHLWIILSMLPLMVTLMYVYTYDNIHVFEYL